jgi:hypothetical protein
MHLPQAHSPSTIDAALLELVVTDLSVGHLIHSTSERLYRAPLCSLQLQVRLRRRWSLSNPRVQPHWRPAVAQGTLTNNNSLDYLAYRWRRGSFVAQV